MLFIDAAYPPPPAERWEPFNWSPALLTRRHDAPPQPWYQSLKLWFAAYAVVWFYLY